jgi:uncharacterized membrane protein
MKGTSVLSEGVRVAPFARIGQHRLDRRRSAHVNNLAGIRTFSMRRVPAMHRIPAAAKTLLFVLFIFIVYPSGS